MIRHSSSQRVVNVYQREAVKPVNNKLSPSYKKVHKSKNFQVMVMNPDLKKTVTKVEKKQSLPKPMSK